MVGGVLDEGEVQRTGGGRVSFHFQLCGVTAGSVDDVDVSRAGDHEPLPPVGRRCGDRTARSAFYRRRAVGQAKVEGVGVVTLVVVGEPISGVVISVPTDLPM